jgi:excisionase family DNA binding protein
MSPRPDLLTIAQVMKLLRCSRSKIYRLHHSGALHFVKMGRRTFVVIQPVEQIPRSKNPARMRVAEAAQYVGLAVSTLNGLRSNGGGPRYIKLGNLVFYDVTDLDIWINANKVSSTAERKERERA